MFRAPHRSIAPWFLGVALWCLSVATAIATPEIKPGMVLESLAVGSTLYSHATVRSISARTVVIMHADGMTSIRLRDLSPEWQARFGYDPATEAAVEQATRAAASPAPKTKRVRAPHSDTRFEMLLQQFGQPAEVRPDVDLRPTFFKLELGVKNQGRRPSCAIFSIVGALEFQNAELTGQVEKLSEEYLIWAVRKTVQRVARPAAAPEAAPATEDADEGFSLSEVVNALRTYGIPLQASMPNTFGRDIASIEEPAPAIVAQARAHRRVYVHEVAGRDPATRINNLVHAMNTGVPVAIGIAWPNYRTMRGGYLANQQPAAGTGHAVTLVGYKSPTGRLEDVVFIFKNSYGPDWGQGGYGQVTYGYLVTYLRDAVLLEVQLV